VPNNYDNMGIDTHKLLPLKKIHWRAPSASAALPPGGSGKRAKP